jgi:hypothetical protein
MSTHERALGRLVDDLRTEVNFGGNLRVVLGTAPAEAIAAVSALVREARERRRGAPAPEEDRCPDEDRPFTPRREPARGAFPAAASRAGD